MKISLITLAFGIGLSAMAGAQLNNTDRNFQRLDKATTNSMKSLVAPNTGYKQEIWVGPFASFPGAAQSYGGSLIYVRRPLGESDGSQTLQFTGTYTHFYPSGGPTMDQGMGTLTYQFTSDNMYAITPGASFAYTSAEQQAYAPFISATKGFGNDFSFTPTASYYHNLGGGTIATGWVPDFMVTFTPTAYAKGLTLYADYTTATIVNGEGNVQVGAGQWLDDKHTLKLKAAITMASGTQTGYAVEVLYKF